MILGIDYGKSRVGVAISEGRQAEVLVVLNRGETISRIVHLCQKEDIATIVVGLPEGRLRNEVMMFGKQLGEATGKQIVYHDETLTSQKARDALQIVNISGKKRQQREHILAAQFILQSYLDEQKHSL